MRCLEAVGPSPALFLCMRTGLLFRHGHSDVAAAVSSLRRTAGGSGLRFHPCRDHRLALVDPRLDHSRAPPRQSVSNPFDRAGRRRDDVRSRHSSIRGAVRDPAAADDGAWLSLQSRGHRWLGDQFHARHGAGVRRPQRRSARALESAGGGAGGAAFQRRPAAAALDAGGRAARGALPRARRLAHGDARAAWR